MKFRAHETFFIRKGWLSKGMKHLKQNEELFISKEINPNDVLGIGTNMVKSLRYWLQAVGITEEPKKGKRIQSFTDFGEIVFENDRYLEEMGTLYLLHYHLAKNYSNATSWYFFFNEFKRAEFSKDEFAADLLYYFMMNEPKDSHVAIRSIEDDFTCIIGTYLPRYKINYEKVKPENNIDSPLGELGLVDIVDKKKKIYKKTTLNANTIDPWVAFAVIIDQANGKEEISLNELLNAPCNIGKVFNLDSIAMLELLHRIENTGVIKIIRTAGLDIVRINNKVSFIECVEQYYKSIEKLVETLCVK